MQSGDTGLRAGRRRRLGLGLGLGALVAVGLDSMACTPAPRSFVSATEDQPAVQGGIADRLELGGERAASLRLPRPGAVDDRGPLLVLLHGFGSSGENHAAFFAIRGKALARGMRVIAPDGTRDREGRRFWNATEACCNLENRQVDDVRYILDLIDEAIARGGVDPGDIHLLGHSNGGFLALRIAREHPERIASAISVAGAGESGSAASAGPGSVPVRILQIHGTADGVIRFAGGSFAAPYPSADETLEFFARRNGCADASIEDSSLDLDGLVAGAETHRVSRRGCPAGGTVELWSMAGSGHMPRFGANFADAILDWIEASRGATESTPTTLPGIPRAADASPSGKEAPP